MESATFGAGCFWGVEEAFRKLPGVISTIVGYMGGKMDNPTYKDVCTDTTGHAEVVQIAFDPQKISYQGLLKIFFQIHDPTLVNRQGPDIGSQYRSVIFFHSERQRLEAQAYLKQVKTSKPIATQIAPAGTFYKAEEYHQKYIQKHGGGCHL